MRSYLTSSLYLSRDARCGANQSRVQISCVQNTDTMPNSLASKCSMVKQIKMKGKMDKHFHPTQTAKYLNVYFKLKCRTNVPHLQQVCCSNSEEPLWKPHDFQGFFQGSEESEAKVQNLSAAYRCTTLVQCCTAQQRATAVSHCVSWILKGTE